mmetsp:Transcript_39984/g.105681  ORF Transcript_39984/g.105681 Transcript_39984/m.105681 type:complete len:206 (+) Transcript_39984:275-892(+)
MRKSALQYARKRIITALQPHPLHHERTTARHFALAISITNSPLSNWLAVSSHIVCPIHGSIRRAVPLRYQGVRLAHRGPTIVRAAQFNHLCAAVDKNALRLSQVHTAYKCRGIIDAHGLTHRDSEGVEEDSVPKDYNRVAKLGAHVDCRHTLDQHTAQLVGHFRHVSTEDLLAAALTAFDGLVGVIAIKRTIAQRVEHLLALHRA